MGLFQCVCVRVYVFVCVCLCACVYVCVSMHIFSHPFMLHLENKM